MNQHRKRRFFLSSIVLLLAAVFISCHDFGTDDIPDGWQTSTPEAQGMDGGLLTDLANRIRSGSYGTIRSLVIVRHGVLVLDEYFNGAGRQELHPVYSVTKSVTSILIGIAKDRGGIQGLDTRVLSFFPEEGANLDSNKRSLTLRHLLTMRAGFDWNELSISYTDPGNPVRQLTASSDWVRFVLDRQLSDVPGTRFRYNSGCSILLAGVLRNTTGVSAEEFCQRNLFTPLGISRWRWEMGPNHISNAGWGLSLRPRDMAKIGFVVLKNGSWQGKRIVSEAWIAESSQNPATVTRPFSYGYHWWMMPLDSLAGHTPQRNDILIAWGWGDQFIFVIPALDMVVISTAANFSAPDDQAISFLRSHIIKAVRER